MEQLYTENKIIIGREEEKLDLEKLLKSNQSELLVMYGRRRIGKTYLVRNYFKDNMCYELSGTRGAVAAKQLLNFTTELKKFTTKKKIEIPEHWQGAFILLQNYIDSIKSLKKKVIFFDELPWLDGMHSGFLGAFDYFWNNWCTKRTDLVVVLCGSAASWMIDKIIGDKGGLHNRITKQLKLEPFTLLETETFLRNKNVKLERYQIVQLYMTMGGVPLYLNAVDASKSATQNIENICFKKNGLLYSEFDNLYASLYKNPDVYIEIIKALATKQSGMLRTEIAQKAKVSSGGYLTKILIELEESNFITSSLPNNKLVKYKIYRIVDEYSIFYLKFIEKLKFSKVGTWASLQTSQSYISWCGFAFEGICLKHVEAIKLKLGISAIYTEQSVWYSKKDKAQIDLVLQRADKCINICEIKFATIPYELTAKYAAALQQKIMAYRAATKTNYTIFLTLITTFGVKENMHKINNVDQVIVVDDLFKA